MGSIKEFTLLLLSIFIVSEVQCNTSRKIESIILGLQDFSYSHQEQLFQKLEKSPIILNDENHIIIAVVQIPYMAESSSPVTVHIEFHPLRKPCTIRTNWIKSELKDYQAAVQGNGKIIISLKLKRQNADLDNWQFIWLDPISCKYKSIAYETNNRNKDDTILSVKLMPRIYSTDILAQYITGEFAIITFDNSTKQLQPKFFDVTPLGNRPILIYFHNDQFYYIHEKNSRLIIWPVQSIGISKVGYDLQLKKSISSSYTAGISVDNGLVTFCYGALDEYDPIECNMFKTNTTSPSYEVSIPMTSDLRGLREIFVKNIDANNALIIWIERAIYNHEYVMAQIIGKEKSSSAQQIFHLNFQHAKINYYQADTSHCLTITLKFAYYFNVLEHCFAINFDNQ